MSETFEILPQHYPGLEENPELEVTRGKWQQILDNEQWPQYRDFCLEAFYARPGPIFRTDLHGQPNPSLAVDAFLKDVAEVYKKHGLCLTKEHDRDLLVVPVNQDFLFELLSCQYDLNVKGHIAPFFSKQAAKAAYDKRRKAEEAAATAPAQS